MRKLLRQYRTYAQCYREVRLRLHLAKAILKGKPVMHKFKIVNDEILWPEEWYGGYLYFVGNLRLMQKFNPPK